MVKCKGGSMLGWSMYSQGYKGVGVVVNDNKIISIGSPTFHHKITPKLNVNELVITTTYMKGHE